MPNYFFDCFEHCKSIYKKAEVEMQVMNNAKCSRGFKDPPHKQSTTHNVQKAVHYQLSKCKCSTKLGHTGYGDISIVYSFNAIPVLGVKA
jgi:hypothetical protein